MNFNIGTFNVLNLINPETELYHKTLSTKDYNKKKEWICTMLNQMRCKIIGFQEVFHPEALMDIVKDTPYYSGINEIHYAFGTHTDNEKLLPMNALLSAWPFVGEPEIISEFPKEAPGYLDHQGNMQNTFRRPVIKAKIRIAPQKEIVMMVAHLKSKAPDPRQHGLDSYDPALYAIGQMNSQTIRTHEALALRMIIINERKKTSLPLILTGDLNDSIHSVTGEILMGDHMRKCHLKHCNSYKESKKIIREIGNSLLYSTYLIQSQLSLRDVHYTHIHDDKHESLDHILVSEEFFKQSPNCIGKILKYRTLNDHLDEDPDQRWMKSDHGPAAVSFEWNQERNS